VTLAGTSGCGSSGTREKVPLGWTARRRVPRRDWDRWRWDVAETGDSEGDGDESARVRRGANALWSVILAETSDGDLSVGAVGPAGPKPEGLASGFTPETLSSLDLANEERRAVGDGNADPWLPRRPSVTSSLQLGRLEWEALLLAWSLKFPEVRSRDDAWLGARSSGSSRGGEYGTRRIPGLLVCELDCSWVDDVRPCRAGGADMALRRPARGAGRLSIRRIRLPLYRLGSQICSMSVSCALSEESPGEARQGEASCALKPGSDGSRFAHRIRGSFVSIAVVGISRERLPLLDVMRFAKLRARDGDRCVAARSKNKH